MTDLLFSEAIYSDSQADVLPIDIYVPTRSALVIITKESSVSLVTKLNDNNNNHHHHHLHHKQCL